MLKFFLPLIFSLCFVTSCYKRSPDKALASTYSNQQIPTKIMGLGRLLPYHLSNYLLANNPYLDQDYVEELAELYIEEAKIEGVNHDIAFAQMCHETGFLTFGNQVNERQNNFSGIGATDDGSQGASFSTTAIGIRAQIQHLKAYASREDIRQRIVDPRFHLVDRGTAPDLFQLTGRWATDSNYAKKVLAHIESLYEMARIER